MSALGTKPRCAAVQQVVGYWKCCGPSAPFGRTAALDPNRTSDEGCNSQALSQLYFDYVTRLGAFCHPREVLSPLVLECRILPWANSGCGRLSHEFLRPSQKCRVHGIPWSSARAKNRFAADLVPLETANPFFLSDLQLEIPRKPIAAHTRMVSGLPQRKISQIQGVGHSPRREAAR
jgi:hypothetical protein